jgi:hypothetical protein
MTNHNLNCSRPYGKIKSYPVKEWWRNYWRPYNHYRGLRYYGYYYPYDKQPYFVSNYIAPYMIKYDPSRMTKSKQIVLEDGTIIEGFDEENTNFPLFLFIFLICLLIIIFCYKK